MRVLKSLATLGVATASSYLAALVAWLAVSESVALVAAAVTQVELHRFRLRGALPDFVIRFPPDSSPALFALSQLGFLVGGLFVLLVGTVAVRRAGGWLRVFLAQTVLWCAVLWGSYTVWYVLSGRGPLRALGRLLWSATPASPWVRVLPAAVVAGLGVFASYWAVRHLLDAAGAVRKERLVGLALYLALPVLLVAWVLVPAFIPLWNLPRWVLPLLLVILVGLPAAWATSRPATALRLGWKGAAVVLLSCGLAGGTLLAADDLIRLASGRDFLHLSSPHWRFQVERSAELPADWLEEADRRLVAQADRLGLAPPTPPLEAYLYASTDTMLRLVGTDQPYSLVPRRHQVHHLLAPGGELSDARGDALLLLQAVWEQPGSEAVARAVARYAVGNFYDYELADYAARITREEGPYTLREIFQLDADYLSPLVRDALGGAWVEWLVRRRGAALLPTLYREPLAAGAEEKFALALDSSWEGLERDWRSYQLANADRPVPLPAQRLSVNFHRGISFSHEVGADWGYGSDRALRELERIRALGANAIALVPYAFTRAPSETHIYFGTDESDDRVIRTLAVAHHLGLATALKPQLWAGRGFTGDIAFGTDSEFERWFALYRRWLLHFARMAELQDVELLVIGTELGGISGREAAWRGLIHDLRRVYRGRLTYAAHWGRDFEELKFWDALDYLGVNMYYPLAATGESPRADSSEVQALMATFAGLAKKYGKPVLFTEVGYPASAGAAAEPWKEDGGPLDPELQQRCYATVFEAFYDQPWFAGLYWWKWPSHGLGRRDDPSYSPLGKPALEVLARWYSQAKEMRKVQ